MRKVYGALQLTLRDSSDCQSHGNLEVVDGTSDPGASVDGIVEMSNVDDPHSDADQGDNLQLYNIRFHLKIIKSKQSTITVITEYIQES